MSKTNAQRQAEYRARRISAGKEGLGDRRINGWISTQADLALDRLARHHGMSKRAMLEHIILTTDDQETKAMTDAEFESYVTP